MDDFNYLEEPPPIQRVVEVPEPRHKPSVWRARSPRASVPSGGRDSGPAGPPRSGSGVLLGLAFLVVLTVQGWFLHGARNDIAELRTSLEQAHSSLGQVWESTKGLDQDRMGRLALLADSIRSVFDYAQGQVRFLETTYANLGQRLDDTDREMATALRADQVQRSRLDALERQARTQSYAFEALVRRAQTQEASTHDVNATVASLRGTLGRLDDALAALERRYTLASSRVESLSGWADGFRRAGLSGDAVQSQFTALNGELRRIRMRVDSLRPMGRTVLSSGVR